MAEKKASLTVLGGPLAGTRFVLEGLGAEVLLGSDASCQFQLALAGVSPQHARVRGDSDSAFTIEDAGSAHGLHVNDGRVAGPVPLRNGDIVWLGTPGEADVVMLQCILPARPAASPAPPPAAPEPNLSEDETLALALESETAPPRTEIIETEHAATGFYTPDDAAAASGAPFAAEAEPAEAAPVPFAAAADNDLVVAEDETVAGSAPFVVDSAPPPPPPPHFEDDTREQTYEFEGDQATVVMAGADVEAPAPVYSAETGFMEEEAATVVMASEPEPTVALEPPRPSAPEPPTEQITRSPAAPPPAPPAPASPPSRAAAAAPPAAPRSPRPAAAAPVAAARRPAPRPQPAPRPDVEAEAPARAARSSAPVALYAGLGVAALVALGGGYWAFSKFRGASSPPTTVAPAPPPTVAAVRPTPPPVAATEEPVVEAPVEVQPEPTAPPAVPTPAAVATPSVAPTTTLRAAPSPLPSPTAPAKKGAATPAPVATPAGPSPEQQRAQQVAALLGQADAALASGQYDQAIGHFDEVLRLDPGNGKATAERASSVALRDASRKKFVAGRTVVKTEKASGGLAGFEGAEVQRTPDFSGRIEFEMSPASGLKTGDAWTMKFYLVNDGKKPIKIGGITATTNVNGTGAGGPVAASTKEVAPQQRVQLGQVTGSWRDGTTAWAADVLVTANKGDSLKNTLTWK